jgi:hypothetical protein
MRGTWVAARIDQGVPGVLGLAVPVDLPHRYLDDPVGLWIEPRRLDVDQREVVTEVDDGLGLS